MNWHAINWGNLLVDIMISLDVVATVAYACQGDWKKLFTGCRLPASCWL